jgi:hypothetical protein
VAPGTLELVADEAAFPLGQVGSDIPLLMDLDVRAAACRPKSKTPDRQSFEALSPQITTLWVLASSGPFTS